MAMNAVNPGTASGGSVSTTPFTVVETYSVAVVHQWSAQARLGESALRPRGPRYRARVPLRIWCDVKMTPADAARFAERLAPHEVLWSEARVAAALAAQSSTRFEDADVAYGQPEVEQCLASTRLAWVHLRSAGWDRFDQPRARAHFAARGAMLTTSATAYSEPCAQHVLALMLSEARQLPRSIRHQLTDQAWPQRETRAACTLLGPEATVALVGFGSIATRIAELLAAFGARVIGVRRRPTGTEPVPTVATTELPAVLREADHVVDILPGGSDTKHFFDAALFEQLKRGAVFYNIGRGSTVDQEALCAALETGRLRAAYIDVTDPEPLPAEHPLWRAPRCAITPHSAGGHADEEARLTAHLLRNLERFSAGSSLLDRVL
jgi:phosphoglycerate dehydrogenase-like enzyme